MPEPTKWAIENRGGREAFFVDGQTGWLSFIARYTTFPDPRRELLGAPVLVPREPETFDSLRALLKHAEIPVGAPDA